MIKWSCARQVERVCIVNTESIKTGFKIEIKHNVRFFFFFVKLIFLLFGQSIFIYDVGFKKFHILFSLDHEKTRVHTQYAYFIFLPQFQMCTRASLTALWYSKKKKLSSAVFETQRSCFIMRVSGYWCTVKYNIGKRVGSNDSP